MKNENQLNNFVESYKKVVAEIKLEDTEFSVFLPFLEKKFPHEVFATIREVQSVLPFEEGGEELKETYHFYYELNGFFIHLQNVTIGLIPFDSNRIISILKNIVEIENSLSFLDNGFYHLVSFSDFMQIHKDILHELKSIFFNYYQNKFGWKITQPV